MRNLFKRRFSWLFTLAIAALVVVPFAAFADNLQADLNTTSGGQQKTINLGTLPASASQSQEVFLYVDETSGANDNPTYPFNVTGSGNLGATFSGVTFTGPGTTNGKTGTVSWTTPAAQSTVQNYSITVTFASTTDLNESPATITINFSIAASSPPPPTNTAPTVTVTGVTNGNNYEFGSVPAAGCSVSDAEDGLKTVTASLSAITGPLGASGLGSQTASCSYTDAGGLTGTASVTYTIADTTKPALTLPDDVTAEATSAAGAAVSFSASASDLVDSSVSVSCTPASGSTFPLGTTTVSCSATDASGNTQTGTFPVIVQDTTKPALTLPDDVTAEATSAAGAAVTFTTSASDLVDSDVSVSCTPASGSTFPLGTTTVSCSATDDSGNTQTGTFPVIVQDTTAPVIAAHADVTAEATSANGATVTYTAPATTDAVDGAGTATCTPASGSQFALGNTTVTCSAEDAAGNDADPTTFVVHVVDTTAPVIAAHGDMTVSATSASGAIVNYTSPATTDAVDGTGTATCMPASGSLFAPGTTTVTCTATDAAGNHATPTTFKVTVSFQLKGFYQPVDMNGVVNTVKNGSTVPFKFEVFAGTTELTDVAVVKGFSAVQVSCTTLTAAEDAIEEVATATGATTLRYDTTGGQFIYNWKTPAKAGYCYKVTMTTLDGSALSALFKLK